MSEWILLSSTHHVDSPPSLFLSRPQRCRLHRERRWTRRLSAQRLRLRPRPRIRLNTMMLETTGAKTVTSPLVQCLIFSRTCITKHIERFVTVFRFDTSSINISSCTRQCLLFTLEAVWYSYLYSALTVCSLTFNFLSLFTDSGPVRPALGLHSQQNCQEHIVRREADKTCQRYSCYTFIICLKSCHDAAFVLMILVWESLNVVSRLPLPGGGQCGSLLPFLCLVMKTVLTTWQRLVQPQETPVHTSDVNSLVLLLILQWML